MTLSRAPFATSGTRDARTNQPIALWTKAALPQRRANRLLFRVQDRPLRPDVLGKRQARIASPNSRKLVCTDDDWDTETRDRFERRRGSNWECVTHTAAPLRSSIVCGTAAFSSSPSVLRGMSAYHFLRNARLGSRVRKNFDAGSVGSECVAAESGLRHFCACFCPFQNTSPSVSRRLYKLRCSPADDLKGHSATPYLTRCILRRSRDVI